MSGGGVVVRQARAEDVDLILAWRREATEWLAARGLDQWSTDSTLPWEKFRRRVLDAVEAGDTWIAELDGRPVGTITADTEVDPGLWTEDELADALVIHRVLVTRSAAGRGVGEALVEHVDAVAARRGVVMLRLDAWTTNVALHDYWTRMGFLATRVVPTDFPSAALFHRPVQPARTRP